MAIKTIDLRKFKKGTSNIYEACLLISARARQINAKRIAERKEKEMADSVKDFFDENDLYDHELIKDLKFEREINPTVIAQEEYFKGKIRAIYPNANNEIK
jgi:DNA-directed RNA polymerase subunit K/omega